MLEQWCCHSCPSTDNPITVATIIDADVSSQKDGHTLLPHQSCSTRYLVCLVSPTAMANWLKVLQAVCLSSWECPVTEREGIKQDPGRKASQEKSSRSFWNPGFCCPGRICAKLPSLCTWVICQVWLTIPVFWWYNYIDSNAYSLALHLCILVFIYLSGLS